MITLKTMRFSNLFSYGNNNVFYFDKDPITQLIGKNGHGKSSIALILEEVLFNKNSKNIKKADIINRHVKDKSYKIELEFNKDNDEYVVSTIRGSTQTVTLIKNGNNISAHTATVTFKLIEDILGFDHKTFSQLVYQSSSASLEFLTATDTNRKKFLIDLLNLTRYVEAFEVFKILGKDLEKEVTVLESKVATTQAWLDKHLKEILKTIDLKGYPCYNDSPETEASVLQAQLKDIDNTNKKIAKNELTKSQLQVIDLDEIAKPLPTEIDTSILLNERGGHERAILDITSFIAKIEKLDDTCPTCLQLVNRTKLDDIILEQDKLRKEAQDAIKVLDQTILIRNKNGSEAKRLTKLKQEWETLHQIVDNSLPSNPLNPDEISQRLKFLEKQIYDRKQEVSEIEKYNEKASANNARVQLITSQMDEMKSSIDMYSLELSQLIDQLSIIQILQKTFSNSGLIAYKIECLIKDLEDLANEYLAELSDGRFQLTFKIAASDKLNVVITDNGKDIDILALSGGERARVNTATLLAIRKLMQSLSNARINLLILDETIGSLDIEGKEKLIEVLLGEEHLNTILVSHEYTHPLLEKITVIKENNISRLE